MRTKILVVDDDPDLLLLLRVTLASEDFQCLLAKNGQDAVDEAHLEHPDLILLDIMMPVMNGWEVLQRITGAGSVGPAAPVIVVSAKASEVDIARALELGAVDYIVKPFDPDVLLACIAAVVERTPEELDRRRTERLAAISARAR